MYTFGYLKRLQLLREGEGNNGGGGGGNPTNTPNPQQTNQPHNNIDPNANPWEDPEPDPSNANPQGSQPSNEPVPSEENRGARFQEQLQNMDFTSGMDLQGAMEKAREGDMTGLQETFNNVARNAFQQAVVLSSQYTKAQVDKAVETALQKSKGSYSADLAERELIDKYPQAADPMLAPMVKGVFARYLNKGNSVNEAITNTQKYFENVAGKFTPPNRNNRPGTGGGFNSRGGSNDSPFENEQQETDFFEALSQGQRNFESN